MKINLRAYGKQNTAKLKQVRDVELETIHGSARTRDSKYGNRQTRSKSGVHVFDSRREQLRYEQLAVLQAGGVIQGLELQVRYRIEIGGLHICDYIADFRYMQNGAVIVEDAKGARTAVYRLKKRLMLAVHGIEIQEV